MANLSSKVSGINVAFATSLLPRLLLETPLNASGVFQGSEEGLRGEGLGVEWAGRGLKKSCRAERWSHGARLSQGGTGWALFHFGSPVHLPYEGCWGSRFGLSCMEHGL